MSSLVKGLVHRVGRAYVRSLCRREYESQSFRRHNERPVEYRFLFECVARTAPVTVLDVGTGKTALPSLLRTCGCLVTSTDNVRDYWPAGMVNRHWHVVDDDITRPQLGERFDLVSCISVLEHIVDHDAAVRGMFALLKDGGHLVLTCPYSETRYVENAYSLPDSIYGQDAPYTCQIYCRDNVERWLLDNRAEVVAQEYWQFFSGPYWTVGEQLIPPRRTGRDECHQLTCLLFRKVGAGSA